MIMLNNAELEELGIDGNAYMQNKTVQEALNKADSTNRAAIRTAYNQAITDLQSIQGAALTTEASQIQAIKVWQVFSKSSLSS